MSRIAVVFIGVLLVLASPAIAQVERELPLTASNCAIAVALNMPLPDACKTADIGQPRGIVIRLDQESLKTVQNSETQDIVVKSAATKATTQKPNHAAADSENGYFIHFAFNSFDLEPKFKDHLDRLATVLTADALATSCLRVIGHTDSVGSNSYNLGLSEKRAVMVASYLSEKGKIDPTRVQIVAKGEDALLPEIAGTDAKNRRVEFATKDSPVGCSAP